ncbi:MAG: RNA polymerase sigma factor region1.1 domain-containing protein, partial [Alphaproteobacteria bacterium]|nr:RNA polymerase sigma factor region1.1 domain-containing protein [Alphaproteobacteria bacterium]
MTKHTKNEYLTDIGSASDVPLIELSKSNPALKKLLSMGKERGYVSYDELNESLPHDEMTSEQIDETMTMIADMGISIVDSDEIDDQFLTGELDQNITNFQDDDANPEDESEEAVARTDDPVRMYLREMGNVDLLSREGEIEIAKRIESGKEDVFRGLCESPLTPEYLIKWRDGAEKGKISIRDLISLDTSDQYEESVEEDEDITDEDAISMPVIDETQLSKLKTYVAIHLELHNQLVYIRSEAISEGRDFLKDEDYQMFLEKL